MKRAEEVRLLLVEDKEEDAELFTDALLDAQINNHLTICNSGEDALAFLGKEGKYEKEQMPDIIFLDLNMPGMGGKAFLKRVRGAQSIKHIPIIVLTTSDAEIDLQDCTRKLGATGYLLKPMNILRLDKMIKKVAGFWIEENKYPNREV